MMDIRQFCSWMAKPKNGSMDADDAKAKFNALCAETNSVIDESGSWEKNRLRVGVRKADVVIHRDQEVRGRAFQMKDKDIKNATAEDIDKLESRVQRGSSARGASALSRAELAKAMIKGSQAAQGTNDLGPNVFAGGGFSAEAKANLSIGSIRDLDSEEASAEGEPEDDDDEPNVDSETPSKRKRDSDGVRGDRACLDGSLVYVAPQCICLHTHMCGYIDKHMHMYIFEHTGIHTCAHIIMHAMHIYMHIETCICISV